MTGDRHRLIRRGTLRSTTEEPEQTETPTDMSSSEASNSPPDHIETPTDMSSSEASQPEKTDNKAISDADPNVSMTHRYCK